MNAVLKTGTTFHVERPQDVWEAMRPLMQMHWEEVAFYRDMPLNVDYGRYVDYYQRGALRIYAARIQTMLVGYSIFLLTHPPHYKSSFEAHQDTLFVHPDHRRGGTAVKLMEFSEDDLALEGVEIIRLHVKAAHDPAAFLRRMGYSLEDHLYSKRLNR